MDKKATVFEFTSYKFESAKKRIIFNYKTEFQGKEPLFFTETIILPKIPNINSTEKKIVDKLLKSLHIIIGISYYKLYCPPAVAFAKAGATLSKKEADFWNTVYKNGLGEFFYKNKLNPNNSPKFPFSKTAKSKNYLLPTTNSRCLVGIGGGKDSIVAAELLKEGNFDTTAFSIQTNRESSLINNIINTIDTKSLKIKRFLDPKVFDSHKYSGHIPISAIYAFLGILSAVLYKYSYFIVGNEYSSNFGNIRYKGQMIYPVKSVSQSEAVSRRARQFNWVNHQWSKSFEFEKLFQDYISNFITPDIFYFSLLRPFYEIRIVKMFSRFRKYFKYFSSCNKNFKTNQRNKDLWCLECPKCVFVFTLLSAFLSKKDLINIFKKNLYQDKNLLPLFRDILGFGNIHPHTNLKDKFGITIAKSEAALPVVDDFSDLFGKIGVGVKPFDCVGTFKEAKVALYLASKKYGDDFIMRQMMPKIKINEKDIKEVFSVSGQSNVPEQFKFLGMENVLILGYGKEGKITQQYFKKYFPNLKIGIADAGQGRNYLMKQKDQSTKISKKFSARPSSQQAEGSGFDMAVKTPGIHKDLVTIPYTTATNIFFSKTKGKNLIIGVTGSKGKSTTSSLIFEILKRSGRNVKLLGNIGKPMMEELLIPIKKDTIFVLELSSYQLDDIKFSPDISVVTNLFPEHMDYHKGLKHYYSAKKNIINFQNKDDYFVYDPDNKKLSSWLREYRGKARPFAKSILARDNEISLLGEHNKNNIKAAIAVAKILSIPDTAITSVIKKFKGLPHRLEFVGEFKGIKFYNDGSSTNPESAILAIKALKNIDTIFLGGEDRGYNFSDLEKIIKKYKIRNIALFPDSGDQILKSKKGLNILNTPSMEEAVKFAYKNTKKGTICLLSGGSPSYSLWENFEEKGKQFQYFIKKLGKNKATPRYQRHPNLRM